MASCEDLLDFCSSTQEESSVSQWGVLDENRKSIGKVLVGIWYKKTTLYVRVSKAKNLSKANVYIKVRLIPDHNNLERQTKIITKTCNPKFKETLKFKLKEDDIFGTAINCSVWNVHKTFGDIYIGEFEDQLYYVNLKDPTKCWHELHAVETEDHEKKLVGTVTVSLKYSPADEILVVNVKDAEISNPCVSKMHNWVCVIFLVPMKLSKKKQETQGCISLSTKAEWNEDFQYDQVSIDDISNSLALEISVWDKALVNSNKLMGSIRLGSPTSLLKSSLDLSEAEVEHWANMLFHPGQWVEFCHELRPTSSCDLASEESDIDIALPEEKTSNKELSTDANESDISLCTNSEMELACIKGRLLLCLEYFDGLFVVKLKKGEKLALTKENGSSDSYVKVGVLHGGFKSLQWQSLVVKNTENPNYGQQFMFRLEELNFSSCDLIFSVWSGDQANNTQSYLGGFSIHPASILIDKKYCGYFNLTKSQKYFLN